MIARKNKTKLQQSQEFESHSFGIKQEGMAGIFNVLRNQLYSDKILAVIREYSTNAVDAHVEVGKEALPIEISLPTKLLLEFKVRDYGTGLTDEQISQIYAMYGESTKRGTNKQIGQLGLGCKSAFAYGDNFLINSYVEGVKTSYNAFIDPSQIGRISKLTVEKTGEKCGIEIVIPVKLDDVEEFYKKAVNLFKYFEILPTIKGASGRDLEKDLEEKIIVESNNKTWQLTDGDPVAIMGNIAYEIDHYALNLSWSANADDRMLYDLISAGIRVHCEIGELDIAASREALQYTDETKSILINRLKDCIKELPEILSEKFKVCKTLWEAKVLYKEFFSHGGIGDHIKNIIEKRKGIVWNGIAVTDSHFTFRNLKSEQGKCIRFSRKHGYREYAKVRGKEEGHLVANSECLVIFDDRTSANGRLNRIAPLIEEYDNQPEGHKKHEDVYLLTFENDQTYKKWLEETKFDLECKNLSEFPPVKLREIYPSNSTTANSGKIKPAKHQTKEFTFNKDASHGRYHNCRSDYFDSVSVDLANDSGVYIEINSFHVYLPTEIHPHFFNSRLKGLEALGIIVPEIYAFKPLKADKVKSNSNWIKFQDWAEKKIKEKLTKEQLQKARDREYAMSHFNKSDTNHGAEILKIDGRSDYDDSESINISKLTIDEQSLYLDYYNKFKEMLNSTISEQLDRSIKTIREFGFGAMMEKVEPTYSLNRIILRVLKRYPMLRYGSFCSYRWKESIAKEYVDYINVIDITCQTENRTKKVKKITKIFNPKAIASPVAESA